MIPILVFMLFLFCFKMLFYWFLYFLNFCCKYKNEVGTALFPRIHVTLLKGVQDILRANFLASSVGCFFILFYFCLLRQNAQFEKKGDW